MAKNQTPAKTPGVAIARVLRGLGLKQGLDFGVRGERKNGERIGTRVAVFGRPANQTVADNADMIERLAAAEGFHFNVSVYFSPSGTVWVHVGNYGEKTRQTHFLSATPVEPTETPEDQSLRDRAVALADDSMAKLVGEAMDDTLKTEAGQAVAERKQCAAEALKGLAGQVTDAVDDAVKHGIRTRTATPRISATLGAPRPAFGQTESEPMSLRAQDVAYYYPKGQRVQGVDNYGVTCMGTVNGVAWGAVSDPSHANYGRTWADVDWDEMPHNRGTGRRSRPFTSDLIKH